MRIHADIKRPARFIIGLRPCAIQISAGRRIPRCLRITGTVVTNIEQVIHSAGQAQVLFTSQVALSPTMLYGLTSFNSLPDTASPL